MIIFSGGKCGKFWIAGLFICQQIDDALATDIITTKTIRASEIAASCEADSMDEAICNKCWYRGLCLDWKNSPFRTL
jgi:hypothetical protein